MLKHFKFFRVLSQEGSHSLNGCIADIVLGNDIRHSFIKSFDNNLGLIFIHPQNDHIEGLHNRIDNYTIFNILCKFVDNISKVLFTTINFHQLNFAEFVVGWLVFFQVKFFYLLSVDLCVVFFYYVEDLL